MGEWGRVLTSETKESRRWGGQVQGAPRRNRSLPLLSRLPAAYIVKASREEIGEGQGEHRTFYLFRHVSTRPAGFAMCFALTSSL